MNNSYKEQPVKLPFLSNVLKTMVTHKANLDFQECKKAGVRNWCAKNENQS